MYILGVIKHSHYSLVKLSLAYGFSMCLVVVQKDSHGGEKADENSKTDDVPSIVALTKNLSLDSQPIQEPDTK